MSASALLENNSERARGLLSVHFHVMAYIRWLTRAKNHLTDDGAVVSEKKRLETLQSQKHNHESKHNAKADSGVSKTPAVRNKSTYLIIKCAANKEAMQNTTDAKQENTYKTKTAALTSQHNKGAPDLQEALLANT